MDRTESAMEWSVMIKPRKGKDKGEKEDSGNNSHCPFTPSQKEEGRSEEVKLADVHESLMRAQMVYGIKAQIVSKLSSAQACCLEATSAHSFCLEPFLSVFCLWGYRVVLYHDDDDDDDDEKDDRRRRRETIPIRFNRG